MNIRNGYRERGEIRWEAKSEIRGWERLNAVAQAVDGNPSVESFQVIWLRETSQP